MFAILNDHVGTVVCMFLIVVGVIWLWSESRHRHQGIRAPDRPAAHPPSVDELAGRRPRIRLVPPEEICGQVVSLRPNVRPLVKPDERCACDLEDHRGPQNPAA